MTVVVLSLAAVLAIALLLGQRRGRRDPAVAVAEEGWLEDVVRDRLYGERTDTVATVAGTSGRRAAGRTQLTLNEQSTQLMSYEPSNNRERRLH